MSTELTVQQPAALEVRPDQAPNQSMLQAVIRMSQQPDVDPARLREFLSIGRELEADQARREYNQAWEAMAPELPYVAENGLNTFTNNRYAKWDDIHRACMPVLRRFGFSVSFDSRKEGDVLYVVVVIRHRSGHEDRPSFPFPWRDPSKGRSAADEVSAALSKAQRHAFRKAFNILSVGEEEKITQGGRISEEKQIQLLDILTACEDKEPGTRDRFARWLKTELKTERVADLYVSQVETVDKALAGLQKKLGLK